MFSATLSAMLRRFAAQLTGTPGSFVEGAPLPLVGRRVVAPAYGVGVDVLGGAD